MGWRLYCPKCGWVGNSEEYEPFCPICGSPLEIKGELKRPKSSIMGEGGTPLVYDSGEDIHYKLEYLNPTGSFKDRGVAINVWLAKNLDYKCVVVDSSGNTALSTAAYSRRLDVKARIHAPKSADISKLRLIRSLEAELYLHENRERAFLAAVKDKNKCYYIAHQYNPIFLEGVSTLGDELVKQNAPTTIVVPVSSGSLLLGLVRGMMRHGKTPHIIAVQSIRAPWLSNYITPVYEESGSSRLLDALVVKDPPRKEEASKIVRELIVLSDSMALTTWRDMLGKGFIVEPSSSIVYAAIKIMNLHDVVLVLTGSGLKYHHIIDLVS